MKNLLLLFIIIPFYLSSQIIQPKVQNNISNLHVNDIAQDDLGVIWIATAKGLCRYDGMSYANFFHNNIYSNTIASDNVNALYYDGLHLWAATGEGISKFDTGKWTFSNYNIPGVLGRYYLGFFSNNKKLYVYGLGGISVINEKEKRLDNCIDLDGQVITSAIKDKLGRIWLICDNEQILCFDSSMNLFRKIDFEQGQEIYCLYLTPQNDILVGSKQGTLIIDHNTYTISTKLVPEVLKKMRIRYIRNYESNKAILVTKDNELKFFDFKANAFVSFNKTNDLSSINLIDLTCAFPDKNRNLWLGTFNQGIKLLSQKEKIFDSDKDHIKSFKDKFITRIRDDDKGNLWIGTRYNGLIKYDKSTHLTTEYNTQISPLFKNFGNFIQALFIDRSNRLWICSDNNLLIGDISTGQLIIKKRFADVGNIVTISEDSKKRIWIGSSSKGITIYGNDLNMVTNFLPAKGKSNNITCIIPFSSSSMLFSAFGDNIYFIDINSLRTKVLDPNYSNSWHNVINIKKNLSTNNIIIGTYGNGVMIYDMSKRVLKQFVYNHGLQSNDIVGIEEDVNGNYWISSSYGIYRINSRTLKIQSYFTADGTGGDQYHEKSECITSNGNILFGGNHGLTEISPGNINSINGANQHIPILLTDLKLFNKSIPISTEENKGILTKHISRTKEVQLRYDENVFSLDFVGLTYDTPQNISYGYRLVGFDNDWNYVGSYNRASYSNLASGKYIFQVKTKNGDMEWGEPQDLITITILSSPWMHPLAILLYTIIFLSLLYLINRIYIRIKLNKERSIMEQNEIHREKALAQMKVNFFTNISHELRTPLTMIYNPVKILLKDESIQNKDSISLLTLINKNSERLLKLIDQILDYGKLKNDTLELKVSMNDCIVQIKDIINIYKLYAAEKNISVELYCPYESLTILYDIDKIDKIINNLLFNSVKYTPIGGHVITKVDVITKNEDRDELHRSNNYLHIMVIDDGIGVEKSLLPTIFDRFRRLVAGYTASQIKGSGLGLNYVKHLVENHKGTIIAQNGKEKGMEFIVTIPIDESMYSLNEFAVRDIYENDENENLESKNETIDEISETSTSDDDSKVILIVEDNKDMCKLLNKMLKDKYLINIAEDGIDALEKIKTNQPDLIISDIMMPRMNGFELCHTLKQDAVFCHLPIILLTAKTLEEDKIKGYNEGADLYLNKPFNPDLLLAMIDNLFKRTEQRQDIIVHTSGGKLEIDKEELERINQEMSPLDKKFLDKLNNYIELNISNNELNVNFLGRELGFSRTNFYRKVKALTGMTPNDFLRVYRLNRAAELIKQREFPLNEISEMTGFGTQSHFSSCFKKYFGISPKDYLSSKK